MLITITGPFFVKIYHRNNNQFIFMWRKYYPCMLVIMGGAFKRVRTSFGRFFYLIIIDFTLQQYFLYFRFINMPAIHPAAGMPAVYNMGSISCKRIFTCNFFFNIYRNMNRLAPLVLFNPEKQQCGSKQSNKREVFFKHLAS